jgi:hypothetical protein
MKYCCVKFEEATMRDRQSSPNIRIVKFLDDRGPIFKMMDGTNIRMPDYRSGPFSFFITVGYPKFDLKKPVPSFNIDFCPFCGVNLYKFYSNINDVVANETEGETFTRIVS